MPYPLWGTFGHHAIEIFQTSGMPNENKNKNKKNTLDRKWLNRPCPTKNCTFLYFPSIKENSCKGLALLPVIISSKRKGLLHDCVIQPCQ